MICELSDTIGDIKDRLETANKQHGSDEAGGTEKMRLLLETSALEDEKSLQDLEIKDNAILNLVFAVSDEDYENVDIVSTAMEDA